MNVLNGDGSLDVRQGIIPHELKILIMESVNGFYLRIELHDRERTGRAGELFPRLVQMVPVQVQISERMDEFPGFIPAYLGGHKQQQRIGSNVEGNPQKKIRAALVKLEGKAVLFFSRLGGNHAKLEQGMARREGHVIHQGHIPRTDDVPPRPWIVFQAVNQSGNLVNGFAVVSRPAAPLRAVHGPQIPVFVGPFIPDADAVVFQKLDIGLSFQEPEQLINDGA